MQKNSMSMSISHLSAFFPYSKNLFLENTLLKQRIRAHDNANIIYENARYLAYSACSYNALLKLGINTKWAATVKTYYYDYVENGFDFVVLIDKKNLLPLSRIGEDLCVPAGGKICVVMGNSILFVDAQNEQITEQVVISHFPPWAHIKKRSVIRDKLLGKKTG